MFKSTLEKVNDNNQLIRIKKILQDVEMYGILHLKTLTHVKESDRTYLLLEAKSRRPPYRLYFVLDELNDTLYIMDWSHKNIQQKTINKIAKGIKQGLLSFLTR